MDGRVPAMAHQTLPTINLTAQPLSARIPPPPPLKLPKAQSDRDLPAPPLAPASHPKDMNRIPGSTPRTPSADQREYRKPHPGHAHRHSGGQNELLVPGSTPSSNGDLLHLYGTNGFVPRHSRNPSQESTSSSSSSDHQFDCERGVDQYFQRLASQSLVNPPQISPDNLRLVDSCRGILFALAQIYRAVRQCVGFTPDEHLASSFANVLHKSNQLIQRLIHSLESFDASALHPQQYHSGSLPTSIPAAFATADAATLAVRTELLQTCSLNVSQFRTLVAFLQKYLKQLTQHADVRFSRNLLLVLHGAVIEIKNAWDPLSLLLIDATLHPQQSTLVVSVSPQSSYFPPVETSKRPNRTSLPPPTSTRSQSDATPPLLHNPSTPNTPLLNTSVPSPGAVDVDTQIFISLQSATNASVGTLALLSNAVDHEVQSLVAGEKDPAADVAAAAGGATSANSLLAKLRILQEQTQQATEATKRVQRSLANMREGGPDAMRRIWEDTNAFITGMVAVMTSVKSIHKDEEYAFPTQIRPGLSQAYHFTRGVVHLWPVSRFPEEGYFLGKEDPEHDAAPPATPGSMSGTPGSTSGTPGGGWSTGGSGGGVGTGTGMGNGNRNGNGNGNGHGVGTPMLMQAPPAHFRRPTGSVVGGVVGGPGGE